MTAEERAGMQGKGKTEMMLDRCGFDPRWHRKDR
jgi:hypothetical protein